MIEKINQNFYQEDNTMGKEKLMKKKEEDISRFLENDSPEEALRIVDVMMGDEKMKWREKMQRKIMNYFFDKKDIEGIKMIIAATENHLSQEGRIKKLKSVFPDEEYSGPIAEKTLVKIPKTESDFIKNEITKGDFEQAYVLIEKLRDLIQGTEDKSTDEWNTQCAKLDHRERELMNAFIENGDIKNARIVVETMIKTPHNIKYESKEGRLNKLKNL